MSRYRVEVTSVYFIEAESGDEAVAMTETTRSLYSEEVDVIEVDEDDNPV